MNHALNQKGIDDNAKKEASERIWSTKRLVAQEGKNVKLHDVEVKGRKCRDEEEEVEEEVEVRD